MRKQLIVILIVLATWGFKLSHAQNAPINITLTDSLCLPAFGNSDVYPITQEMPNGDIFFYVWINDTQEEHHYTYWYRKAENMFTDPQYAGASPIIELGGELRLLSRQVFENKAQFLFGYYEEFMGNTHIHLRASTVTDSSITVYNMGQFHISRLSGTFRFAGEDKVFIASDEGLFLHNFVTGETQRLLDPELYILDPFAYTRFHILPDGNFLYTNHGEASSARPAQWIVYSLEGEMLSYQEISDPQIIHASLRYSFTKGNTMYFIDQRSYQPLRYIRCTVGEDYTFEFSATAIEESDYTIDDLMPFGEDMLVALMMHNSTDPGKYMFLDDTSGPIANELAAVPVEIFFNAPRSVPTPEVFHWVSGEGENLKISSIFANDLSTIYEHDFSMDTSADYGQIFWQEEEWLMMGFTQMYFFQIETPSSNQDNVTAPPLSEISIYPNPVHKTQGFQLETSLKQPLEMGIYNIKGQLVRSILTDATGSRAVMSADLHGLNTGIYFLKARGMQGTKARKFILMQ